MADSIAANVGAAFTDLVVLDEASGGGLRFQGSGLFARPWRRPVEQAQSLGGQFVSSMTRPPSLKGSQLVTVSS